MTPKVFCKESQTPVMEQQQNQRVTGERWSYANFVRRNPVGARSLESFLQYAGFFAPVRSPTATL